MKIIEAQTFPGPNRYAPSPVVRCTVAGVPASGRGIGERVKQLFPGLETSLAASAECSTTRLLVLVALELQRMCGQAVSYGAARSERGRPQSTPDIVYEYADRVVGEAVGNAAVRVLDALSTQASGRIPGLPADRERDRFLAWAQTRRPSPTTAAIVESARRRGVSCRPLGARAGLLRLGQGRFQRRLASALSVASDRYAAGIVLEEAGLPVPARHLAWNESQLSSRAQDLGFPVLVEAARGRATAPARLDDQAGVQAFIADLDAPPDGGFLVRRHFGLPHRTILVIDGAAVSATERTGGGREHLGIEQVHPEQTALAQRAAAALDLAAAEVTIAGAHADPNGAANDLVVLAVDPQPELGALGLAPSPRAPAGADALLEMLFPDNARSEVWTVAVCVPHARSALTARLSGALIARGLQVGLVQDGEASVCGAPLALADPAQAAGIVLMHRAVDTLVLELQPQSIVNDGLPVDRVDLALVSEQAATAHCPVPDGLRGPQDILLGAASHAIVALAPGAAKPTLPGLEAARICYVTEPGSKPWIERHLAAGGQVLSPDPSPSSRPNARTNEDLLVAACLLRADALG